MKCDTEAKRYSQESTSRISNLIFIPSMMNDPPITRDAYPILPGG